MQTTPPAVQASKLSLVLYCLIRQRPMDGQPERYLLIEKQGHPAFPPTKFQPAEDLYHALARVMEGDLGLPPQSYFLESELEGIPNSGESPRYPGLAKEWLLHPVTVSLTEDGWAALAKRQDTLHWWTLGEIAERCKEPNIRAIARHLQTNPARLGPAPGAPSMDAQAGHWAASHPEGVRVARGADIRRILAAGDRAFNLRVADPYLPYQRQGLGFTWSFFTPRDKQDIHVHSLPAVEIYGVLEGRLQLWHKPMNQRGVRVWRAQLLTAGDWAEVEPLTCHLAVWLDPEGLGTVIKACSEGELAGVGRLGVAGKTSCRWKNHDQTDPKNLELHCANWEQCAYPPALQALEASSSGTSGTATSAAWPNWRSQPRKPGASERRVTPTALRERSGRLTTGRQIKDNISCLRTFTAPGAPNR